MSFEQCKNIYEIKSNFLVYNGVISAIKSYQNSLKHNISIENLNKVHGPILPNNIRTFFLSNKGSKDMYNVFLEKSSTRPSCEDK